MGGTMKKHLKPLLILPLFMLASCQTTQPPQNLESVISQESQTVESSQTEASSSKGSNSSSQNDDLIADDVTISLLNELPKDENQTNLLYVNHSFELGIKIDSTHYSKEDVEITFEEGISEDVIRYEDGVLKTGAQASNDFDVTLKIKGSEVQITFRVKIVDVKTFALEDLKENLIATGKAEKNSAKKITNEAFAYNGKDFYLLQKEETNFFLNEALETTGNKKTIRKYENPFLYTASFEDGELTSFLEEKDGDQNKALLFHFKDYVNGVLEGTTYGLTATIENEFLGSSVYMGGEESLETLSLEKEEGTYLLTSKPSTILTSSLFLEFDGNKRITTITYESSKDSSKSKIKISIEYSAQKEANPDSFTPEKYYFDSYNPILASKESDSDGETKYTEATADEDGVYALDLKKDYYLQIKDASPKGANTLVDPIQIESISDLQILNYLTDDDGEIVGVKTLSGGEATITLKETKKLQKKEIKVKVASTAAPENPIVRFNASDYEENSEAAPKEIKQGETLRFSAYFVFKDGGKEVPNFSMPEEHKDSFTIVAAGSYITKTKLTAKDTAPVGTILPLTCTSKSPASDGKPMVKVLYFKVTAKA